MFSKKSLSILLAAVLVCAAVIGIVFVGADAGGNSYTWYVDGVGGADYTYADIDTAMADAKERTWAKGDTLTIYVTTSGTATNFNTTAGVTTAKSGRHLFSVLTIFRADNTKLPITINGDDPATTDTVEKNSLLLGNDPVWTLASQKSFAATNDYTFKNLDLSTWAATKHFFYAGSGMVTFDNVNLGESTKEAQAMTITPSVGGYTTFLGWTPDQFNTNADADGLLPTGFSFKNTNYGAANGTLACRAVDSGISKSGNDTGGGLTIKTNMLKNKLILGKGCTIAHVNHHGNDSIDTDGWQPADSIIEIDGATVTNLYSVRGDQTGMGNKITTIMKSGSVTLFRMGPNGAKGKYTGDVEVKWTGGTITEFWGSCSGTIDGNVSVTVENISTEFTKGAILGSAVTKNLTANVKNITTGFFTKTSTTDGTVASISGAVGGDVNITVEGFSLNSNFTTGAIYGGTIGGNLTQSIKDCDLAGEVYLGANGKAKNVVNNLSGTINTTDYFAYLGTNSQTITGNLTNNISCDWNYTGDKGEMHLFCGSYTGVINGKITNNVKEGADIQTTFHAGSRQANVGSIETNVTGGIFQSNFFGGNRQAGTVGSVTTKVSGGTFKNVSYLADRGSASIDTATITISGGTFDLGFHLGGNIGNIGTLNSTITGGTFKGKIYNSSASATATIDTKTLTIKEEGKELSILSAIEGGCTEFIGNGGTVKIGSGTKIEAEKASGSITFHQVNAWNSQTYFDAKSGSIAITTTQDKGVTGKVKVQGNTVIGMTEMLYGTSFVFTDRVALTFHFLKSAVDATNPDDFTFVVKAEKGRTLANPSLTDIKNSTVTSGKYYSYTTNPLRASEMAYSVSYEGSAIPGGSLNLLDLAARGATMAEEAKNPVLKDLYLSYANYAVSVRNYLAKKAGDEAWALPTLDTAPVEPDFTPGLGPIAVMQAQRDMQLMATSPSVSFYGRSLLLDEGIRIRYYGKATSATAANSLTLYVNNKKVESPFTYVSGQTYPLRMDIPISVTEGETMLRITIKDANGKAHFDYVDRLDRLAYELGLVGETEMSNEALYYFQSAVTYEKDARTKTVLNSTIPTDFSTGYSTVDATPYGVAATINNERLGVDTSEPINVTCVAFSDGNPDNTVLYFSIPARKVPDSFIKGALEHLSTTTNVKEENIFFNATHSHSAPNITAGLGAPGIGVWYNDYLYPAVVLSAQEALLDLTPSTAYVGSKDADPGTASVRRFFQNEKKDKNGNVVVAAGTFKSIQGNTLNTIVKPELAGTYESEIDRAVRTIEFKRTGKDPILLVNWQGHAASAVGYLVLDSALANVSKTDEDAAYISADFVYYLEESLKEKDYLPVFFNGGSGDINCAENLNKENVDALMKYWGTTQIHYAVGNSLGVTANAAAKAGTKVNTGSISSTTDQEVVTVRKDPADRVDAARLCNASFNSVEESEMVYNMYGFDSGLEITHMLKRNDTLGDTDEIPLSAVTFGDLAFTFAPFELFHETATQVRQGVPSSYKMTFVCGYTNGDDGYMPTTKAFKNEGYEHYACFYVDGTAEQCAQRMIELVEEQTK